jgi:AraC-like DNA-binding protein
MPNIMERQQLTIHFAKGPDKCAKPWVEPQHETTFPMQHAQRSILEHTDATLYVQAVDGWQFAIRLYTLDATRGQPIAIRLRENGVFFIYLLAGRLYHLLGGGTPFRLQAQRYCGCYLPAGDYPISLPPGRHELFLFGFPYGYFVWLTRQYPLLQPLAHAWKNRPRLALCLPKATIQADERRTLARMARCHSRGPELDGLLKAYLSRFIARYHERLLRRSGASRDEALLAAVRTYVEHHFADPGAVKLAAVAEHFGQPPSSLRKAFTARYGRSMAELAVGCRIAAAKALLADTTLPLGTIAERVGFAHTESLRGAFRKAEELSPMAYRITKQE